MGCTLLACSFAGRMFHMRIARVLVFVFVFPLLLSAQTKHTPTLDETVSLKTINTARISPDGKYRGVPGAASELEGQRVCDADLDRECSNRRQFPAHTREEVRWAAGMVAGWAVAGVRDGTGTGGHRATDDRKEGGDERTEKGRKIAEAGRKEGREKEKKGRRKAAANKPIARSG